jgi:hypothetical protein
MLTRIALTFLQPVVLPTLPVFLSMSDRLIQGGQVEWLMLSLVRPQASVGVDWWDLTEVNKGNERPLKALLLLQSFILKCSTLISSKTGNVDHYSVTVIPPIPSILWQGKVDVLMRWSFTG